MTRFLALLLFALPAFGAVTNVVPSTPVVQLMKGTTYIKNSDGTPKTFATVALCEAEALRLWTIEGPTRTSGTAIYKCVHTEKWTVSFGATACPPKPADETRPGACPAGTTGAWTQLRTYISASAPTCWTASAWTPATAPTGTCVAIPPPTTETWTRCAAEYGTCAYTGIKRVRYGAGTAWNVLERSAVNGGISCTNEVFGDPIRYTEKTCEISDAVIAAPPPPTGTATVSWVPVTLNTDNTPATITAYRIYYGRASLDQSVTVPATERSRVIGSLASGTYQFTVTASSATAESARPAAVTKVIP